MTAVTAVTAVEAVEYRQQISAADDAVFDVVLAFRAEMPRMIATSTIAEGVRSVVPDGALSGWVLHTADGWLYAATDVEMAGVVTSTVSMVCRLGGE